MEKLEENMVVARSRGGMRFVESSRSWVNDEKVPGIAAHCGMKCREERGCWGG